MPLPEVLSSCPYVPFENRARARVRARMSFPRARARVRARARSPFNNEASRTSKGTFGHGHAHGHGHGHQRTFGHAHGHGHDFQKRARARTQARLKKIPFNALIVIMALERVMTYPLNYWAHYMNFCLKMKSTLTLFCMSLMTLSTPLVAVVQDQDFQEVEQPSKPPVQPRPIKHTFVSPKLIEKDADELNQPNLNTINSSAYEEDEYKDSSNPLGPDIKKTNSLESFMKGFMNMMITVLLMAGTIYLIVWGFKRFLNVRMQQLNTTSNIKIMEKRVLSPKSTIYVIEVYDKQYIIAESPTGIHNLGKGKE